MGAPHTTVLLLALLIASPARAITFAEALARAGRRSDVTAPDAASASRAAMDRETPGRVGNPELQAGFGPGSTEPGFRGVGAEFQATLTVPFALDDLGGARRRSADAEREGVVAEGRRRSLEQRRHAARAWLAVWTAQRAYAVAGEEAMAAQALGDGLQRAVTAGAAVTADALEAQLAAADAHTRALDAEGALAEAATELAARVELAPTPRPTADGDPPMPAIPAESSWPRWIAAAGELPEARAAAWLARAAELLADEARANGTTWASVGAQAVRNSADQWQLYAMLGIRPSLVDRNQRARAQALSQAALARGDAESARHRAAAALALALHEVEHARSLEALLRASSVPVAERLAAARDEALRRGAGTVFDVLRARAVRLRSRAELVRAEGRRAAAELDAWLLLSALQGASEER